MCVCVCLIYFKLFSVPVQFSERTINGFSLAVVVYSFLSIKFLLYIVMWVCVVFCLIFYYFVIYLTSNFNKPRFLLFFVDFFSTVFSFFLSSFVGLRVCLCVGFLLLV